MDPVRSPAYAEATRLSWPQARDEEEADVAGAVSFGDGGSGAVGSSVGVDRAALP